MIDSTKYSIAGLWYDTYLHFYGLGDAAHRMTYPSFRPVAICWAAGTARTLSYHRVERDVANDDDLDMEIAELRTAAELVLRDLDAYA